MKRILILLMFASGFFTLTNCGGDDVDCTDPNINQIWADEFQAAIDAGTLYATDPSSDNCNAYKDALRDYLDVIKQYEECFVTADDQQEFNEAVQEAQGVINTLSC